MDWIKIIGIIFGATGFWKLVEVAIRYRTDRKVKKAEASNLYAQAGNQIVESWVHWSQKLEARVKELEETNAEMKSTITKQKARINGLVKKVESLMNRNNELVKKLEKSQNGSHES